jgi:hypothetical protein
LGLKQVCDFVLYLDPIFEQWSSQVPLNDSFAANGMTAVSTFG